MADPLSRDMEALGKETLPKVEHTIKPIAEDSSNIRGPDGSSTWKRWLVSHSVETRGIQRVEENERHDLKNLGFAQIGILWFSINLVASNITLGMLGPAVFGLDFLDSSLCAIFGMLVGCLPTACKSIDG